MFRAIAAALFLLSTTISTSAEPFNPPQIAAPAECVTPAIATKYMASQGGVWVFTLDGNILALVRAKLAQAGQAFPADLGVVEKVLFFGGTDSNKLYGFVFGLTGCASGVIVTDKATLNNLIGAESL